MDSTSDNRIKNNVMRHEYRVLSAEEKDQMQNIKDQGAEFYASLNNLAPSPEVEIAKIRIQEAVMWAVKSITQ